MPVILAGLQGWKMEGVAQTNLLLHYPGQWGAAGKEDTDNPR